MAHQHPAGKRTACELPDGSLCDERGGSVKAHSSKRGDWRMFDGPFMEPGDAAEAIDKARAEIGLAKADSEFRFRVQRCAGFYGAAVFVPRDKAGKQAVMEALA